jgi:hypothetical protein
MVTGRVALRAWAVSALARLTSNPIRLRATEAAVTYAIQRSWLHSTSRERRKRTTTEHTASTNIRMSPTPNPGPSVPMTAEIAATPMGLGTPGRCGESCVVADVTIAPATSTIARTTAPRVGHSQRRPGSLPVGKK